MDVLLDIGIMGNLIVLDGLFRAHLLLILLVTNLELRQPKSFVSVACNLLKTVHSVPNVVVH